MIYLLWIAVLALSAYVYLRKVYTKFDRYGVKYLTPDLLLGNMTEVVTRKKHMAVKIQDLYNSFPGERFTGMYDFLAPTIHINDPELIKMITVKDFEYFMDRRALVDDEIDILFGRNLFNMKGHEWKDMRSTLSPAFTSSKMRAMVPFMVEVNEQMIRVLKKKIQDSKVGAVDIDCKDLMTRYATDVIASCAFGVKLDSHSEEDNHFYRNSRDIANFDFRVVLTVLGYLAVPELMKKMKIKLLKDKTSNFFDTLVMNNMREREKFNIHRPDMIHLLMEAKKAKLRHDENSSSDNTGFATVEESEFGTKAVHREWSDGDLVAQAVLFLIAGFETVSTTLTFLLYELGLNPEVQEKLFKEIMENDKRNAGKFDYNSIQNMKYMDMVVSEVLRLWPPVMGLMRECIKDYNIGRPNKEATEDYIVRKGQGISIPVWPIQRDAKYFPEPEKFIPERFSDENKGNIEPFSYMPFGVGPRNCIGSRFALCEVKVMAYQMIKEFQLYPCEKTTVPGKLDTSNFNMILQGGTWLSFKLREQN